MNSPRGRLRSSGQAAEPRTPHCCLRPLTCILPTGPRCSPTPAQVPAWWVGACTRVVPILSPRRPLPSYIHRLVAKHSHWSTYWALGLQNGVSPKKRHVLPHGATETLKEGEWIHAIVTKGFPVFSHASCSPTPHVNGLCNRSDHPLTL